MKNLMDTRIFEQAWKAWIASIRSVKGPQFLPLAVCLQLEKLAMIGSLGDNDTHQAKTSFL